MKSRLPLALALALPGSLVLQPTVWVNTILAIDVLTEGSLGLSKTSAYTRYVRLQVELWRPPREAIPLPEIDMSNATPGGLHALTHGWTRPAVVRNALKGTPAVQAWSDPEWWRVQYGNESVNVIGNGDGSRSYMDLNSAFDQLPTHYISFSTSLMARFAQLREMMSCNEAVWLVEAGFGKFWQPVARSLFIGIKGHGSVLHNAGHLNFFGQFAGRKRWSMALPSETAYVGATTTRGGLPAFVGSTQLGEWWERVRRYEVVLEPGDLLINPAWTWHATEALGEAGDIDVGVASRYVTGEEFSGLFFDKYPHTAGSGGLQTYPFASFLLACASAREFVRTSTPYEAAMQLFFGAKAGVSPFSTVFKDNTTAEQYGGGTHNQHDSSGLPVGWVGAMEEKFSGY